MSRNQNKGKGRQLKGSNLRRVKKARINKVLCEVIMGYKKIYTKFWFLFGNFQPDPHRLFGDFENPLGQHAVPSGIFKIPLRAQGIWVKIPSQKPEFSI